MITRKPFIAWIVALILLPHGFAVASAMDTEERIFDLAAGDAAETLKQFAAQADREIIFPAEAVAGVKTKAVKGSFTARDALDRMLSRTGLTMVEDFATGALMVKRATSPDPLPVPSQPQSNPELQTSKELPKTMKRKSPIALFLAMFALGAAPAPAQTATGAIEGRVLNATSGQYLNNARITVEGTTLETFTDSAGRFRLTGAPVGKATVKAFYTGFPAQTATVAVAAGETATQDFSFAAGALREGEMVVLDAFLVTSTRETNARNIAINEQRFASNIKNVIAADTFGDIPEGNVGEFIKYLPGITVDYVAADVRTIAVRGFQSNYTGVNVDGVRMASAASAGTTRAFELEQVSMNNISRIEVTKVPTPDMSADSLGGSVNMVSRSAFESARTQFRYRAFLSINSYETELFKKTPGPEDKPSYKIRPGFDFNYIAPLTKDFGIVINGLRSDQFNSQYEAFNTDWRWVGAGATPAAPYLKKISPQFGPKSSERDSFSVQANWRPAKGHVISAGAQASYYHAFFRNASTNFDVGGATPLSFSPTSTIGAAGGSVKQGRFVFDKLGSTSAVNLSHRYNARNWEVDSGLSYSKSMGRYRTTGRGHFAFVDTSLVGVSSVRFDGIVNGHSAPDKFTALDAAGNAIDFRNINNYRINSVGGGTRDGRDEFKTAKVDAKRRLDFLPFEASLKVGGLRQEQERTRKKEDNYSWQFVGKDGIANTADDNAGVYLDPMSVSADQRYGFGAIPYPDIYRLWDVFQTNPGYFLRTEANEVKQEEGRRKQSFNLSENVTAAYAQVEARLWNNRLGLVTGVRFEKTEDDGRGPLNEPDAIWQRDASGKFIVGGDGLRVRKPEAGAAGSLEALNLTTKELGNRVSRSYDGYYPSLHATFNLTKDFIVRAAFAKTLGRPDLGDILPNTTIDDNDNPNPPPGSSPGTITHVNTGLKPYSADNYDLSLEYYFPKGGLISAGVFRKDLTDFFGSINETATPETLAALGLDPKYVGWTVKSKLNLTTTARVTGAEFNYSQPLAFLPGWGKYFNFYASGTALHLMGPESTSFRNFIPKSRNLGLTFSKKPLVVMIKSNYRGRQRAGAESSSTLPGGFLYFAPRTLIDVNVEYQLGQRVTFFANARNLFNKPLRRERSSPDSPAYSRFRYSEQHGVQIAVGVKGTF